MVHRTVGLDSNEPFGRRTCPPSLPSSAHGAVHDVRLCCGSNFDYPHHNERSMSCQSPICAVLSLQHEGCAIERLLLRTKALSVEILLVLTPARRALSSTYELSDSWKAIS